MKKNIRRIVTFLLLGTLITGVTGCGGSSTQTAQTLQKEFCYISEYRELEITSEYIQNVVQKDDVLYMLGYTWNEQTEEGTCVLYGYHLGDGTYCEAAVDFLQNVSVQQMILNEAGNLLLVIQRYEEMEEYTELWEISASDGKLLSKTDIHSVFDETEGFYLQYVVMDAAVSQFNNDIISGNCPDIINITNLEFERYAGKGVFEDLYPYMEKDGIQQSEYLENVLGAYEIKDSLYAIIPQFYVSSAAIKSSRVGDATGWTLDEMLNLAENSDVGKVFCYGTRSSVFYYCVYNNIDEFINWETGECFFDSEEFIRVLEFAAQFPEEADYKEEMEGISEQIRNDNLLVLETQVSSVQEYQMMTGLFGEKITFIGYPNSERKGNLIQPANDSIAISAQSNRKDAAWEFVKIFLSEEYQNNLVKKHNTWGFPIKKSALDKQFENDMTPDYYDINGKQIENPKTTWGYDDFQMDIYAATSTEVDAVRNILTSAEKIAGRVNEELIHIITEETQAFFQGQKSVGDTVRVIQNRIQIYVNENS